MVNRGLVTQTQLGSDATIFFVSDDPTDAQSALVTAEVVSDTPPSLAPGAPTQKLYQLRPVVAAVNKQSLAVSSVQNANWNH